MKIANFTSVVVLTSLFSSYAFSAIPKQVEKKADLPALAEEILTMPEKNRIMVAQKKSSELYPVLVDISRNEKKSMPIRWKALTLATRLDSKRAMVELEKNLQAPEWFMRNAALVSMRAIQPDKAKAAALKLLKDKALVVRSAAVDALSGNMTLATRDALWEEMDSEYNYKQKQGLWIRKQILEQLAAHPEKKEIPLLVKVLKEKDESLHPVVFAALEKVSSQTLGKKQDSLEAKRKLWLKWAKANSAEILN